MSVRIALHVAFWLAYWFIYAYTYSRYDGNVGKYLLSEGLQMPARMLATYAAIWCFERLKTTGTRDHWKAFGGAALATILGGAVNRLLKSWWIVPTYFPDATIQFWDHRMLYDLFDVVLACSTAISARMYFRHQELQRREETLRAEKLAAELQALRNQIHPHFLFNTINNLYVLARMKSDKTPQVALKLAHLLRYVLYESAKQEVTVAQEIQLLKDYVSLEQLRFDTDRLKVEWQEKVDEPHLPIAPLLLLPLVENAFKHGAGEKRDTAWVGISLRLERRKLELEVANSTASDAQENPAGIGVKNLRRQLELTYPDRHLLDVRMTEAEYFVRLSIDL